MNDFSIGKKSNKPSFAGYEQLEGYQKQKKEYEKFLKKAEKSDMANSPTLKQKQLEMLQALRETALREGNCSEVDLIDEEIQFVSASLTPKSEAEHVDYSSAYHQSQVSKNTDLIERFNACKNKNGEIDNETRRLVLAFKDVDVSTYNLSKFVERCRHVDGYIPKDLASAVEKMCSASISPNVIFDVIDECTLYRACDVDEADLSLVDDLLTIQAMGVDDVSALQIAKNVTGEYDDKQVVFTSAAKLMSADFDADMASQLISTISVKNPETGKKMLLPQSVNSLINMKKKLASSHFTERNERQNPINKLGQVMLMYDDTVFVMKDDKVVEVIQKENETVLSAQKEYEEFASEYENKLIISFAERYGMEDGKIDSSALRTFIALRNAGVSYGQLLPLTQECLEFIPDDKENGMNFHYDINVDKVNAMTTLKKAGALSQDILTIMDALSLDDTGKYSKEDINNATTLTGLVIAGKEVASLIPQVRNDDKAKGFVSDFSQVLERKEGLVDLVSLVKGSDGVFDEEASEIVYAAGEHLFCNPEVGMKEPEFLSFVAKAINASKAPNSKTVDVNSTNVCIAMCRNNESAENILTALELCKDEFGYPNESLADILWDMSAQHSSFEDITTVLNICKPVSGILDIERAAVIAELLDNGCKTEDVMKFAKSLGRN